MPGNVKTKTGQVVSDRMEKSVVVAVEMLVKHPLYKKRVRRTHRFQAHDEANEARVGDVVRIAETRPISKNKTWRLLEIVRKSDHTTV
ncbi:MAG: 30S ribosomal protein S17 [Chloroflexota bacterium]|nr:MAG: 30S ribosomal protein S17 [Chloroflexota bacterium]